MPLVSHQAAMRALMPTGDSTSGDMSAQSARRKRSLQASATASFPFRVMWLYFIGGLDTESGMTMAVLSSSASSGVCPVGSSFVNARIIAFCGEEGGNTTGFPSFVVIHSERYFGNETYITNWLIIEKEYAKIAILIHKPINNNRLTSRIKQVYLAIYTINIIYTCPSLMYYINN